MRAILDKRLVLWRFLDGKPGHENQTLGLVGALRERIPELIVHDLIVPGRWAQIQGFVTGRFANCEELAPPDLIVGAGHKTHSALLITKRAYGGQALVLMKPSLPMGWFDLLVVPEHDDVSASEKCFVTRGVLNTIKDTSRGDSERVLVLLGGPSSHHAWDNEKLLAQLETVVRDQPNKQFVVTSSRRTPAHFWEQAKQLSYANIDWVPFEETQYGWVAEQLALSGEVWVSEDSVSMLYEALTSGASVGVFELPRLKQKGRVIKGLDSLIASGMVTPYRKWLSQKQLTQPKDQFNEADRCADWLIEKWLKNA